jgi:hypothetical protein
MASIIKPYCSDHIALLDLGPKVRVASMFAAWVHPWFFEEDGR